MNKEAAYTATTLVKNFRDRKEVGVYLTEEDEYRDLTLLVQAELERYSTIANHKIEINRRVMKMRMQQRVDFEV